MAENTDGPGTGRYAAYDTTLQRFVGGVHSTQAKAKAAGAKSAKASGTEADAIEVREV